MGHRNPDVFAALLMLAGTDPGRHDVGAVVDALVQACSDVLETDEVVVLLAGPASTGRLSVTGSSSRVARELGAAQLRSGGPADHAHGTGLAVHLRSTPDPRWPGVLELAGSHGLRSVSAVPLRAGEHRVGAASLFWRGVDVPAAEDVPVAEALGRMAAVAVVNHRHSATLDERAVQLEHALESRALIEQAKGMLAARGDMDVTAAFELMRVRARATRQPLAQIAAEVVRGLSADGQHPARS